MREWENQHKLSILVANGDSAEDMFLLNLWSKLPFTVPASPRFLVDEAYKVIYIPAPVIIVTGFVVLWEEFQCWESTHSISEYKVLVLCFVLRNISYLNSKIGK